MIPETDQKDPVLWAQDILQEDFKVMLMLPGELMLASTEVHNQAKSQGNIDTVRKEGDFLKHSILEDLDIVFGQVVYESAARISGGERDVH